MEKAILKQIKAIGEGSLVGLVMSDFMRDFDKFKSSNLCEHFQYAMYKVCSHKDREKIEIVYQLVRICYSEDAIGLSTNMEILLGSLHHVFQYLFDTGYTTYVLQLCANLESQKSILWEHITQKPSVKSHLYSLHGLLITFANKDVTGNYISFAKASLSIASWIDNDETIGRKLWRNVKCFLNDVKQFEVNKISDLLNATSSILKIHCNGCNSENMIMGFLMCKLARRLDVSNLELDCIDVIKYSDVMLEISNQSKEKHSWKEVCNIFYSELDYKNCAKFKELEQLNTASDGDVSIWNCLLLTKVMSSGFYVWCTVHKNNWDKVVTYSFVKMLFSTWVIPVANKFLQSDAKSLAPILEHNTECCACMVTFMLANFVNLLRLCFKYKIPNHHELVAPLRKTFVLCYNCIRQRSRHKCPGQAVYYSNAVEDIFAVCLITKSYDVLRMCSQDLVMGLIGLSQPLPFCADRMTELFSRWCLSCTKEKKFTEALFVSALGMLYNSDVQLSQNFWTSTKAKSTDINTKTLTVIDVLKKHEDLVRKYVVDFKVAELDQVKLMLLELESYAIYCLPDMNTAVASAWKRFSDLYPDKCQLSRGLCYVVSAALLFNEYEHVRNLHKLCVSHLAQLHTAEGGDVLLMIYKTVLKFLIFHCNLKLIQETSASMGNSDARTFLEQEQKEKVKMGQDVDLNVTCDIVPTSNMLTVEKEEELVRDLGVLLVKFQDLSGACGLHTVLMEDRLVVLRCVKQMALLFELYGCHVQAFTTWDLYLNFARVFKQSTAQLYGWAQLIKNLDSTTNSADSELLSEARLLHDSEDVGDAAKLELRLALALWHLKKQDWKECLLELKASKELLDIPKYVAGAVLRGRHWMLTSQLLTTCPHFAGELGCDDITVAAFNGYHGLHANIMSQSLEEQYELVLARLHANLWCVKIFVVLHQASMLRSLLEPLYTTVQDMVLPSRTAEILLHLIEIDIMCHKWEEADAKYDKLKGILLIADSQPFQKPPGILPDKSKRPVTLQVPSERTRLLSPQSPSSPIQTCDNTWPHLDRDVSPFRLYHTEAQLHFPKHTADCCCHTCGSLFIEALKINAMSVEGQLHTVRGDLNSAYKLFKTALPKVKNAGNRCKSAVQLTQHGGSMYVTADGHLSLLRHNQVGFLIRYGLLLLDPSWRQRQLDKVDAIAAEIDRLMLAPGVDKEFLEWPILEFKVCALALSRTEEKDVVKRPASPPAQLAVCTTSTMARTPPPPTTTRKNVMPRKCTRTSRSPNPISKNRLGRKLLTEDNETPSDQDMKKPESKKLQGTIVSRRKNAAPSKSPLAVFGYLETPGVKQTERKRHHVRTPPTSLKPILIFPKTEAKNENLSKVTKASSTAVRKKAGNRIYIDDDCKLVQVTETVLKRAPRTGRVKGRKLIMDDATSGIEEKTLLNEGMTKRVGRKLVLEEDFSETLKLDANRETCKEPRSSKHTTDEDVSKEKRSKEKADKGISKEMHQSKATGEHGNVSYDLFASFEEQLKLEERDKAIVTADRVTADRVTADRVTADRVTADRVTADRVTADRVTADRVTADRVAEASSKSNKSIMKPKAQVKSQRVTRQKTANR